MTVGVPNSGFTIRAGRGAAKTLANASEGGWAGVRVGLDRDYRPGESFEIGFSIEQSGLFHAAGDSLALDFTPGWYDRAAIGQLTVTMIIAAPAGVVKSLPAPTKVEGQEITWVRQNLSPGQQVRFSASFPKAIMPGVAASKSASAPGIPPKVIILIVILVVVFLIWLSSRRGGGGYSNGGTIFYGGGRGSSSSSSSRRSSGGGGGFGGSSSSCACACVSCACACACAGGGGAGCAKKTTHSCPFCKSRRGGEA
jgi:hypothetical protein